ncbi:MAG: hypothetical protein Q4B28_06195 [bacterium]|nr:hypothetical protein [bacterium]
MQQEKNLTLIHHYYLNKEQFPGYRSSFAFKDIALSEQLLDVDGLKMISGHLHAPFVYKNYLCTGSVWATSPLEANQLKGVWKYQQGRLDFYALQMITYFQLEAQKSLVEEDIRALYQECQEQLKKQFENQSFFPF